MINFDLTGIMNPNSKFLKNYIVMHVYLNDKDEKYLLLGRGKASDENLLMYKEINYLYMNMKYINKYIPKNMKDVSELFRSIQKDKKDLGSFIKVTVKPIWALKDLGKLYNYTDEQVTKKYEYTYKGTFMTSMFDNKFVIDLVPNSYAWNWDKDLSEIYHE